jgi:RNA polymerase-binding transcription factor
MGCLSSQIKIIPSGSRARNSKIKSPAPPNSPWSLLTGLQRLRRIFITPMTAISTRKGMDKRKAEVFRKRLIAKQSELLRLVSKSEQDGREADEEATQDIADKAANSYTKEFLFHQSDDNRRMLNLVNEALNRIKTSSFGLCVACQEEVQAKRLDAVPWARHCIECQEKQEQGLL